MNERTLRPGNVAAAAVLIGGVLLLALPRFAVSIVQVVIVTVAVVYALYALAVNVPEAGWISPFKWMSPFHEEARPDRTGPGSDELDAIRSKLTGRRQTLRGAAAMPPEALRLLKPLIRATLDLSRAGERARPPVASALRSRRRPRTVFKAGTLSAQTRAVLTTAPLKPPYWYRTLWPDERAVAEATHAVLDDLDRLLAGEGDPHPREPPQPPLPPDNPRAS